MTARHLAAWAIAALACVALSACGDDTDYSGGNTTGTASNNNTTGTNSGTGGTNNTNTGGTNNGFIPDAGNNGTSLDGGTNNGSTGTNNGSTGTNNGSTGTNNGSTGTNNDAGNNDVEPDVPDTDTIGGPCRRARDCSAGETCIGADAIQGIDGYCTILDCETSAECDFPQGGTFCCSNFGEFRGCFRERDGAECGEGQGQQNDSCEQGGQSDCDGEIDIYCLQFYGPEDAFCGSLCDPISGQPCGGDTYCLDFGNGQGACVPFGETDVRDDCTDDPFTCEEGAYCVGAGTDDPYSYCGVLCGDDGDCDPGDYCQLAPGANQGLCQAAVGGIPEGESCTEDRFGCQEGLFCYGEGTRYARCVATCTPDEPCDEDAGFTCEIYDFDNDFGVCLQRENRPTGSPCGDDPFSCEAGAFCSGGYQNTYNPDAYCVANCTEDPSVCPDGFYCAEFDDVSYCQPDGPSGVDGPCETALDCAQDTFCIDPDSDGESYCAPRCSSDADCDESEYCTGSNGEDGVCYPFGDIQPGEPCDEARDRCAPGAFCAGEDPVCISNCTDDPGSCPDGMYCLDEDRFGTRYCYPEGDIEAGDDCDGPYDCEAGSFCSNTSEGDRICLPGCEGDDDCPDNFWCFRTREYSQCRPEGDNETGDSCGPEGGACAEGHVCIYAGTDDAYCARDCTGFADVCGDGEVCRYIGYGVNLCFPTGELETGQPCGGDAQGCDGDTICVGVGFTNAFCADICTFDASSCSDGTECVFSAGGLGTCLPPDFDPGEPLDGGGPI